MKLVAVVVLFPNCSYAEVATAFSLLSEYGRVLIAGPTRDVITTEHGLKIEPHLTYSEVLDLDPAFLLVPHGDFSTLIGNVEFADLVKRCIERETWFCSIGHGTAALAQFGIFDHKRATHTCTPSYQRDAQGTALLGRTLPWFAASQFCDENVTVDKLCITAKPWASVEFAVTIAIVGGYLEKEAAIRKSDYLFGKPSLNSN